MEAKRTFLEIAARELEASPGDLEVADGVVYVRGAPERKITVMDTVLAAHFKYGTTISGRGLYIKPKSFVDPETGACDPDSTVAHACTVAEVEVDTETGEVTVLQLASAYEVGRAVNPKLVEGQIIGGSLMGMSHALVETVYPYYPSILHQALSFRDYVIPRSVNIPEIKSTIIGYPSKTGPYGVKGVGEMTANSPPAAIVNAIHDAVGIWITDLPITPEKVLEALREKERTSKPDGHDPNMVRRVD